MRTPRLLAVSALALALSACSHEAGAPPPAATGPSAYALAAEPSGSVSVLDAKAAAPKDEAVVVGRVKEVSPGIAAFVIVDVSLPYCGEKGGEDACETPWDYCCEDGATIAKHSLAVAAHRGDAIAHASIPELRPLDLVVVKGSLTKSAKGDVELAATGWYRKDRPTVSDKIKFP